MLCVLTYSGRAQQGNLINASIQDSLKAQDGEAYLVNQLKIENNYDQPLTINISVEAPPGWQLLGKKSIAVAVNGKEKTIVPITLIKLPTASAAWQQVKVHVSSEKINFNNDYNYFVSLKEFALALIAPIESQLNVTENNNKVDLDFNVKNKGNCLDTFYIFIRNYFLYLDKKVKVFLTPGHDSTYKFSFNLPSTTTWPADKLVINYMLSSKKGASAANNLTIIKTTSTRKLHSSAYNTIDADVETGLMKFQKQVSYYVGIKGKAIIDEDKSINYSYRSKQYGINTTLQQNLFSLNYSSKKIAASAGYLTDSKYFLANGIGLKLGYKWHGNKEATITSIKADQFYKNYGNTYLGELKHFFWKFTMTHNIAFNNNNELKLNSGLIDNTIDVFKKEQVTLTVKGGIGVEKERIKVAKYGSSYGYAFAFKKDFFGFVSNLTRNSQNYPGLNKLMNNQYHTAKIFSKKASFGLFYQEYSIYNNPFRDTVFNSDALTQNTRRYGGAFAYNSGKGNLAVSLGDLKSTQITASSFPRYRFIELQSFKTFKNFNVQLSSTNGYSSEYKYKNNLAWFTSSNFSISSPYAGFRAFYNRVPVLNDSAGKSVDRFVETLNLTPFINIKFFKKLVINLNYSLFKTLDEEKLSSNLNGRINYYNRAKDFDITLSGTQPLKKSSSALFGLTTQYYSLTIKKSFNIPIPFNKKYHDINVKFFEDNNNNGRYDKDEHPIKQYDVKIDEKVFRSNKNGEVKYLNIDTGEHSFKMLTSLRALVPAFVPKNIWLRKDSAMAIPFVKSKIINGTIFVVVDSLSNITFSPAGLKITATDSLGASYHGLADGDGNFFINVPSGKYTVSLNPSAFANATFKPEVMSFNITITNQEKENVTFVIKQQKRKVRFLNSN